MSKIEVDAKKNNGWLSLNFAMASTMRIAQISVDNHELWLYEIDGEYVGRSITLYQTRNQTFAYLTCRYQNPKRPTSSPSTQASASPCS